MKHKTNIRTKDSAGININPQIECGPFKGYISGELLDANAVSALIDQKISGVIGGASTSGDTLKELEQAIPTKVSDLNNDSGYMTLQDLYDYLVELGIIQPEQSQETPEE